jgi:DNA polymerase III alpha subunit
MYLNCKTNFSFRFGTFKTEELVAEAESLGVKAMAITNINNTCDVWDFVDLLYILPVKNNQGLLEINMFLSEHLQENQPSDTRFAVKFCKKIGINGRSKEANRIALH